MCCDNRKRSCWRLALSGFHNKSHLRFPKLRIRFAFTALKNKLSILSNHTFNKRKIRKHITHNNLFFYAWFICWRSVILFSNTMRSRTHQDTVMFKQLTWCIWPCSDLHLVLDRTLHRCVFCPGLLLCAIIPRHTGVFLESTAFLCLSPLLFQSALECLKHDAIHF